MLFQFVYFVLTSSGYRSKSRQIYQIYSMFVIICFGWAVSVSENHKCSDLQFPAMSLVSISVYYRFGWDSYEERGPNYYVGYPPPWMKALHLSFFYHFSEDSIPSKRKLFHAGIGRIYTILLTYKKIILKRCRTLNYSNYSSPWLLLWRRHFMFWVAVHSAASQMPRPLRW